MCASFSVCLCLSVCLSVTTHARIKHPPPLTPLPTTPPPLPFPTPPPFPLPHLACPCLCLSETCTQMTKLPPVRYVRKPPVTSQGLVTPSSPPQPTTRRVLRKTKICTGFYCINSPTTIFQDSCFVSQRLSVMESPCRRYKRRNLIVKQAIFQTSTHFLRNYQALLSVSLIVSLSLLCLCHSGLVSRIRCLSLCHVDKLAPWQICLISYPPRHDSTERRMFNFASSDPYG